MVSCPLCLKSLKQHLLQPNLSIISCTNEDCVYPFNLTMDQIRRENLIIEVTTSDIMTNMQEKLINLGVDGKISEFISREDKETT